jgi:hypothetical protein
LTDFPPVLWMRILAMDSREALRSDNGQQICCWIWSAKQCGIACCLRGALSCTKMAEEPFYGADTAKPERRRTTAKARGLRSLFLS